MQAYINLLKQSIEKRKTLSLPSIKWVLILGNIALFIAIAMAIMIAPTEARDYHFVSENGIITAISSNLLAMASAFAFFSFFLERALSKKINLFWLLLSLGLGFFALDELLEGHERLGSAIGNNLQINSPAFKNWNDLIVVSYGILALIFIIYFLPTILRYPKFGELFSIAFAFYLVHTLIDSLAVNISSTSIILEESCKLFSSAYFSLAMFTGLLGNIMSIKNPEVESRLSTEG